MENEYEMNLSIRDFRKIRPLVQKGPGASCLLPSAMGFLFFCTGIGGGRCSPSGCWPAVMLLYVLSLFIWDIRIEGNRPGVRTFCWTYLAEEQVVHGMQKSAMWTVRKSSRMLRIHFPDLTWVSARDQRNPASSSASGKIRIWRAEVQQKSGGDDQEEAADLCAERPGRNHHRHSGAKRHSPGTAGGRGGGRNRAHRAARWKSGMTTAR